MSFSSRGDQRTEKEREHYRINPEGRILGSELLQTLNASRSLGALLHARPLPAEAEASPGEARFDRLQVEVDRAMAILMLNRILDNEAMKRKIEPNVSDARVDYVMRSILIQWGADTGKLRSRKVPKMKWVMDGPGSTTCRQQRLRVQKTDGSGRPVFDQNKQPVLVDVLAHVVEEDASNRSNEEMFGWIRRALDVEMEKLKRGPLVAGTDAMGNDVLAGDFTFSVSTGWDFDEGGMASDLGDIRRDRRDIGWPSTSEPELQPERIDSSGTGLNCAMRLPRGEGPVQFSIVASRFPADWQEFREALRAQMQEVYREHLRKEVWKLLIAERNPLIAWETSFAVTPAQIRAMYEALKNSFKILRFESEFNVLSVEGDRAEAFKTRFFALLDRAEQEHDKEFVPTDRTLMADAKRFAEWVTTTQALRRSILGASYGQAVGEFAADIAAGRLKTSWDGRTRVRSMQEQAVAGPGAAEPIELRAFDFNLMMSRPIPRTASADASGRLTILTLVRLEEVAPLFVPASDPSVQNVVTTMIENKLKGKVFRKLAFDLFKLNRFHFQIKNLCSWDNAWPCSYADDRRDAPRRLAEALFPETLYPGQKLPTFLQVADAQGRVIDAPDSPAKPQPRLSSTLNHDAYFDRVQSISIEGLARALKVVNPGSSSSFGM